MSSARAARRDALLALFDETLLREARAEPPCESERKHWMVGTISFSEPEDQGRIVPIRPRMWMPRALCFWRAIVRASGQGGLDEMSDPRHSLAPWPELQQAVLAYMSPRPWSRFRF